LFCEQQRALTPDKNFALNKAYNGEESIKTPKKKPIKRELTFKEK
jgi:hypothetical protein